MQISSAAAYKTLGSFSIITFQTLNMYYFLINLSAITLNSSYAVKVFVILPKG